MADLPPLPPGFQLDQQQAGPAAPPLPPGFQIDQPEPVAAEHPKPSWRDRLMSAYESKLNPLRYGIFGPGAQETIAQMGTGMLSAPIAGLAGIAAAPFGRGAEAVEKVGGALTYQPQTADGRAVSGVVNYPFEMLAKGADRAGDVANDAAGPIAGTAVNTAIQSLPALLFRGRGAQKPVQYRTYAEAERATPLGKEVPKSAEDIAREYVGSRTSLAWDRIPDAIKEQLTDIAQQAGNLDSLPAAALERQTLLQSLPVKVPATRGQLTRNATELRNEGNVSATQTGAPIRATYQEQTKALIKNLEVLKGKVSGTGKTRSTAGNLEDVGMSVQDEALRKKLRLKETEVKTLYKRAENAGELQGLVSPRGILDTIERSPDKTHYGWVESWMNKAEIVKKDDKGNKVVKKVQLKELEDLRQAAVARAMNGGTEGYYAGKVIRAIDDATEGAGGQAYKAARKARRDQALEFEDQTAVAKLVTDKTRTDRAVALENTWQQVVKGGSIDDLRKVKKSLLTGGDETTRTAGRKAWHDIRAQTIQNILNEATKSVTRYEDGTPNLTPASMERAIKSIGDEKLREIFGDTTVNQLKQVMEATRITKTEPPPGFKGSPTLANTIAILEKSLGRIPFLGDTVTGTVKGVANLKDLGADTRTVNQAARSPIDDARKEAGKRQIMERYSRRGRNALALSTSEQGK